MSLDFCCPLRHSILFLTFLCLSLFCANIHVFNFAILLIQAPGNGSEIAQSELPERLPTPEIIATSTEIIPTTARTESFESTREPQLFRDPEVNVTRTILTPTTLAPYNDSFVRNLSNAVAEIEDLFLALQKIEELSLEYQAENKNVSERSEYLSRRHSLPGHLVSSMYSSFAWGAMLSLLPICLAVQKIGLRIVLTVIGLLSGLATFCAHGSLGVSPYLFLACRIVQGFGLAALVPTIATVVSSWAAIREYPAAITMLTAADEVGLILAMPLAGMLSRAWPCAYYLLASLTLIVVAAWSFFYRNQPRSHHWLSGLELDTILERKIIRSSKRQESPPWGRLFTSLNTYVLLTSAFGHLLVLHLLIFFTPFYLHRLLGFSLLETGLFSTAPPLLGFFSKILASALFELTTLTPTVRVRAMSGFAHFGSALALGGLGFVPGPHYGLLLICSVYLFLGFHTGGWMRALVLSNRERSPPVMVLVAVELFLLTTLLPFFVLEAGVSPRGWRLLFLVSAGAAGIAGVVWSLFGSARPEPWTRGFERAFKGAPKLVDGTGSEDEDAVSIDQGIIELKRVSPLPPTTDPERAPLTA